MTESALQPFIQLPAVLFGTCNYYRRLPSPGDSVKRLSWSHPPRVLPFILTRISRPSILLSVSPRLQHPRSSRSLLRSHVHM